jgi:UDP-N-acetylmuramyl pentapeptide synthase
MMELGTRSDDLHRRLGKSIFDKGAHELIALGSFARSTVSGAVASGMKPENVFIAADHAQAAERLRDVLTEDEIILIKGSHDSRMEEVLKCFTNSFTR